jgi:hypothetical protein
VAASNEWWETHLTPRGWEEGSSKVDFGGETDVPVPPDRVKTVRHSEYMSSIYSTMDKKTEVIWTGLSPLRVELERKFGAMPGEKPR